MHFKSVFFKLFFTLLLVVVLDGCSSIGAAMRASPSLSNALGFSEIPLKDLKKRYTNEASKWVKINGLNIHYQDEGEGPTIVLVHGIMSSLQTWDDWADTLKNNYRVIRLDVPGYGLTGGPENTDLYTEDYLMKTFSMFIDELELDKFILVGNSLGGYISAKYAAENFNKVDKLVLLDPIGYPQPVPWIMSVATKPVISSMAKYFQPPLFISFFVKDIYGDPRRLKKHNIDRYIRMAQRPGASASYLRTMEMLKKRSTIETRLPFNSIAAPTLLMWGEADKWVPVDLTKRWIDDIQNAKLVIYPTVGHVPMEEIPEETLADFLAFINDEPLPTLQAKLATEKPAADAAIEGIDQNVIE